MNRRAWLHRVACICTILQTRDDDDHAALSSSVFLFTVSKLYVIAYCMHCARSNNLGLFFFFSIVLAFWLFLCCSSILSHLTRHSLADSLIYSFRLALFLSLFSCDACRRQQKILLFVFLFLFFFYSVFSYLCSSLALSLLARNW